LKNAYAGVVWATREFFKDDNRRVNEASALLDELYQECGDEARRAAPIVGRKLHRRMVQELDRLRNGWTLRYTEMMSVFAAICDLVLVEGHSGTSGVKIEVWRACTNTLPLATEDRSILALITDDSVDVEIPTWSRRDGQALAEQIERLARGSQL